LKASLLSRFKLVLPKSTMSRSMDREYTGVSIDDCARTCNEQVGVECKSFDYCYLTGECRLSRAQAPSAENKTAYDPDQNCDIYNSLVFFSLSLQFLTFSNNSKFLLFIEDDLAHYSYFPSKASINKNDLQYMKVDTAEQCAGKCDAEKQIHCRSFNFCPGSNLCYLSEKHTIDASSGDSTSDLVCDHYSSNLSI
jgi:hypothetical protein